MSNNKLNIITFINHIFIEYNIMPKCTTKYLVHNKNNMVSSKHSFRKCIDCTNSIRFSYCSFQSNSTSTQNIQNSGVVDRRYS